MTNVQANTYVPPRVEDRTAIDNPLIGGPVASGQLSSAAFRTI